VSIPDNDVQDPTRHSEVVVDRMDAIPYRFVPGGNQLTVRDDDGGPTTDVTGPVLESHRDLRVDRGGKRPAAVVYTPPTATDDVDGTVPVICTPPSRSAMPLGRTDVTCTASDAAGNTGTTSFTVTVRRVSSGGVFDIFGRHADVPCVEPDQLLWVIADGYSAGAQLTMFMETAAGDVIALPTITADRKGRVRTVVALPTAPDGDADLVMVGASGAVDLMRMMPIHLDAHRHQHHRWRYFMHSLVFDSLTC
jgi:hypothetical protein